MLFIYRFGMIIQLNAIEPSELTVVIFKQNFWDLLQMQIRDITLDFLQIQAYYSLKLMPKECFVLQSLLSTSEEAIKADKRDPFTRIPL